MNFFTRFKKKTAHQLLRAMISRGWSFKIWLNKIFQSGISIWQYLQRNLLAHLENKQIKIRKFRNIELCLHYFTNSWAYLWLIWICWSNPSGPSSVAKLQEQSKHLWGLAPACIFFLCMVRPIFFVKPLSQTSHLNGHSCSIGCWCKRANN